MSKQTSIVFLAAPGLLACDVSMEDSARSEAHAAPGGRHKQNPRPSERSFKRRISLLTKSISLKTEAPLKTEGLRYSRNFLFSCPSDVCKLSVRVCCSLFLKKRKSSGVRVAMSIAALRWPSIDRLLHFLGKSIRA